MSLSLESIKRCIQQHFEDKLDFLIYCPDWLIEALDEHFYDENTDEVNDEEFDEFISRCFR